MPQSVPAAKKTPADHQQKVANTVGGLQLMYTGVTKFANQQDQRKSVERLASGRVHRVPDAQRHIPKHLTLSYQWTGGGNPAKGFMH